MKPLSVGIGCRLHSSADDIDAAVRAALGALDSIGFERIGRVASLDIKADAPGLRAFCARHALPLHLFSREQIAAVPLDRTSAAARAHVGVDGVCEPCALLAAALYASDAASPHASRLLVRKTVHAGVTVAIATSAPDHLPTAQDLR